MGLRAMISAVLKAATALIMLPIEVVIDGVRVIRRVLGIAPAAPMGLPMADVAEEVVAERTASARTGAGMDEIRRHVSAPSEPERVRRAARELLYGRSIPTSWLDPAKDEDAEILLWLSQLDALQLGMLVKAPESEIGLHLTGIAKLRMPLLPRDQVHVDERKERRMPLSYEQWVRFLSAQAAESGHDDPDVDAILDLAEELAGQSATLDDYKPSAAAAVSVDDDE